MNDETAITWRADSFDGHVTPTIGRARDGIISVGTVTTSPNAHGGEWSWSMTATGRGLRGHVLSRCRGHADTKEGAKAAVEQSYRELLAADPLNRPKLLEHTGQLRRSDAMWAGRIPRST